MIYLVDGSHLLHRMKHVPGLCDLSDSRGRPTGMVMGFLNSLIKIRRDSKSTAEFVICWDKASSAYRTKMYTEYKGDRYSELTDEDRTRLAQYNEARLLVIDVCGLLQIPTIQIHGVEADDIIGHFSRKKMPKRKVILSEDSDLYQLLNDDTDQYCPVKGKLLTKNSFIEEYSLIPEKFREQYIMILSMTGTHNNVEGIKGIGSVTARKISEILLNGGEITPTSAKNKSFLEHRSEYERNIKLVDIYHGLDNEGIGVMIDAEVTSKSCLGALSYNFLGTVDYLRDLELNRVIQNICYLENSGYRGPLL